MTHGDARTTPRGERFPKWVRLTKRPEFKHVYAGGRKAVRRHLVVYAVAREDETAPTRVGLTATRKIGKAVIRNRFRRRMREAVRREHARLEPGYDIVVNARMPAAKADYAELHRELLACLRQLDILKDPTPTDPTPTG